MIPRALIEGLCVETPVGNSHFSAGQADTTSKTSVRCQGSIALATQAQCFIAPGAVGPMGRAGFPESVRKQDARQPGDHQD